MLEVLQLSALDELWVELTVGCGPALTELVRVARKQYSPIPEAAALGVPSVGMVAFLLLAGERGVEPRDLAVRLKRDRELAKQLATKERILSDALQGGRRFQLEWISHIGAAGAMDATTLGQLVERSIAEYPPGDHWVTVALDVRLVVAEVQRRNALPDAERVVLTSIQAVHAFARSVEDIHLPDAAAEINGVVTHRKKYSSGLALRLTDGLDSVAATVLADASCFEVTKEVRENDRASVVGRLGRNRTGEVTIFVDSCERLVAGNALLAGGDLLANLQRRGLPPRFWLGKAVQHADDVLNKRGFVRYEPSYISAALQTPDAVESLDVYFPGWGARTSLVPTPVPQLIRAGIGLGVPRIFATGRVFTRAIRDGFTSPDSPTVFIFLLRSDLAAALAEVEELLHDILDKVVADASLGSPIPPPPWPQLRADSATPQAVATGPHHRCDATRPVPDRDFTVTPFATVWPGVCVMAEGHVAEVAPGFCYSVASIHVERLLQLLTVNASSRRVGFHGPEKLVAHHAENS